MDADTVPAQIAARGDADETPPIADSGDALRTIAANMLERLDDITEQLVRSIVSGDTAYQPQPNESWLVSRADLTQSCHDNLGRVLRVLAGLEPLAASLAVPRATGERRAQQGLPLEALLHAYRLGGQVIWQEMVFVLMTDREDRDTQGLLGAATAVWAAVDAFSIATAAGYRRAEAERDIQLDRRLTTIMDALLSGRSVAVSDALALGLPQTGNFVVIAAVAAGVQDGATAARRALSAQGIVSVWRPHGDREVGIAMLPPTASGAQGVTRVVDCLCGTTTGSVGVSSPVHRLGDIPSAFADAAHALDTLPPGEAAVATLGDRLLPAILCNSPDLAQRHDRACLGALDKLSPGDRDALIDTLAAWFDADADVRRAAELVFCHRNTVHNRLRRIETLTGMSTQSPTDIAMLYLSLMSRRLGLGRDAGRDASS